MIRVPSIGPFKDRILNLCDEYNLISTAEEYVILHALGDRNIEVELLAVGFGTLDYRSYLLFPSEAERMQFLLMVGDYHKFKSAASWHLEKTRNKPYDNSTDWWDW